MKGRRATTTVVGGALFVACAAADASAQETGAGGPGQMDARPLSDLVAELPGIAVSLEELLRVAMSRNLPLRITRAERALAEAGVDVEAGAFDLALTLGGDVAKSRGFPDETGSYAARLDKLLPWGTRIGLDLTSEELPALGDGRGYDTGVGLSFSQPILEGFRHRDTDLQVARRLDLAAVERLGRTVETVAAAVELAYWELAEAEAAQAVRQRSLEIAEALLFRNEQLAERDLAAEVDVVTARSGVALRRASVVDARRARLDAAEALVFLVWGEAAESELARDSVPLKTTPSDLGFPRLPEPEAASAAALERRRDVAAARMELDAAREAARGARNRRLPLLNLEGSLRTGGSDPSLGGSLGLLDQGRSWSLGFNFVQPLRNRRESGLDRVAELNVELRSLELRIAQSAAQQEVRSALRGIAAGRERLASADEAAALARVQLDAERRRLDLGLSDSFRLLETEENAVQAELESVRARFDLARALTRYGLATGLGAER